MDELTMLRARLAAVEQLLSVHEQTVLEQADRLDSALVELRTRASEAERAQRRAERTAERLRFLSNASRHFAESLDYETTLRNVAKMVVPSFADYCAIDLVDNAGTPQRLVVEHVDPERVALVRELREKYPDNPDAEVGVHHVLRTREPEMGTVSPELLRSAARDEEHLRILESLNLRSYIIVPLIARDRVMGVLTLVLSESDETYDDEDLHMATELAARAALAIDAARLVRNLTWTQQQLEQSAVELEAQTEELQATVEELESTTQDLLRTNEDLAASQEEAERARAIAETANAAKARFLATMSHELRTPLNAIDGYAELLELGIHGPVTPEQLQALERLRRAQKRLLALITDVLNFARLEAGQESFELRDVPVADLFADIEPLVGPQVQAREQELTIQTPAAELRVRADTRKAEQILLNLIANAIKFTPAGGRITLCATPAGEHAAIRVSDNGEGVPHDRADSIFEPFVQVRSGAVPDQGGVGLGLAISRDLARAMGGDITLESVPGNGSVFTLLLPVSANTFGAAHP
jgi:signal transduction histidine kinase